MPQQSYDIIVIGAGPGGYVAAIRAAQLGFKTAVVEREHLGGICLNWGCIPTKALLRSAEIHDLAAHAGAYGFATGPVTVDMGKVVARSRAVAGQLNTGVGFLLKKNRIDVIWGEATVTRPGEVTVAAPKKPPVEPQPAAPKGTLGAGTYGAKHIIIATGARPRVLPGIEADGERIWSYFEAMVPASLPKSLVIVGSGAIGVEFASFYRALGSEVTLVEVLPRILPAEDAEIAALAQKRFEKDGIRVLTGAKVVQADKGDKGVSVGVETGGKTERLAAERLISAAGVIGNVEGLGLEQLGVKQKNGTIAADGLGRTSVPGVYAIGDVAGPPLLAHKAEHEGGVCVEAIAGLSPHALDKNRIPGCTYCHPQIASVGLTEEAAAAAGLTVKIGRFPFRANGKAIALGDSDGLVKTIFDGKTGELLGAHMIGPDVTELIQGFVIAMQLEATEEDLMRAVFPHPTLSEAMHESVLAAFGRAIHV